MWLNYLFTIFLVVNSVRAYDYEYSPMEDPLGPIWDRLDSLSKDVLKGFQEQMGQFLIEAGNKIDAKFRALTVELNKTTAGSSTGSRDRFVQQVNNAVAASIESLYFDTIKKDNEAAIAKAQGDIKVQISALENKVVEHINVKINSLMSASASNSSSSGSGISLPAGSQIGEIEEKITDHITTKLTDIEDTISRQLGNLASSLGTSRSTLESIGTHVTKIIEELADVGSPTGEGSASAAGGESCSELVDKVSSLVNNTQLSTDFLEQQESRWKEMQSVIAAVKDTPSFLPRDCSDIHWLHHEALSGVYQIYPTLDRKAPVNAWCDMVGGGAKSDGGWTVILRRRETDFGHVDFNRTWKEYASGFGDPAEGEWWFSLRAIHSLTYRQPYKVRFELKDIERGSFYADYENFRVEDEAHKFRLIVDGFSGNVTTDAFKSKHHGRPFSTPDEDNDNYGTGSCALSNSGGWWFNACYYTTLTAPFPTSDDRTKKTIRWVDGDTWLVLNDVTVKIRPTGYDTRFDAHGYQ